MAWNYKHNTTLPNGTIVNAPDNDLRGNICYIDINNGYANQAAVDAITGSGGQEVGSANYPYSSWNTYNADYATHSTKIAICAKGIESLSNYNPASTTMVIIGDEKWSYKAYGNGGSAFIVAGSTHSIYNIIIDNYTYDKSGNSNILFENCIVNVPIYLNNNISTFQSCIILKDILPGAYDMAPYLYDCILFGITFSGDVGTGLNKANRCLIFNCTLTAANLNNQLKGKNIFYFGLIQYNSITYDISAAITLNKSEATIISEMNVLWTLTLTNADIGIMNPYFINTSKGNFNLNFIDYPAETTAIITRLLLFGMTTTAIKKGVKCEWDAVLATSDFIFSASSPHYSALDGFGGLICRNMNANGTIVNTAYDTIAVSKIITLSAVAVLDFLLQFGTFGAGALEWDELYVRAVASGAVEDEYSIAQGYTASYAANVFTCDWPRFYLNREQKCNKVGDKALGSIDLGSYNLNEARSIFKTGAIEFQFILVKRGV